MNIKEFLKQENQLINFYCENVFKTCILYNKKLTSLEGLPEDFSYNLKIVNNNIRNLNGLPENFNASINLSRNKLKNLKGLPKKFNNKIELYNNPIENLVGLNDALDPRNIKGLDWDFIVREYIRLGKAHLLI